MCGSHRQGPVVSRCAAFTLLLGVFVASWGRYQEYKGWQAELEELNKVDSHAMDKEEKVKHRDRMVELSRAISSTKQHYSFVPQPRVHAHATLEDNVKMHKLYVCGRDSTRVDVHLSDHLLVTCVGETGNRWEAIHKTNDKDERAKLKKELEDLRERLRFDAKHRTFDEVCTQCEECSLNLV